MAFIVLDFETTGLSAKANRIIEIGYALVVEGKITEVNSQLVDPGVNITNPKITEITGIDNSMIAGAPALNEEMKKLHKTIEGKLIVAHNAPFDMGFLNNTFYRMTLPTYHSYLCTANMFRQYKKLLNIDLERASLEAMTQYFGIVNKKAHRAGDDAQATAKSLIKMCEDINFRDYMVGASKGAKFINRLDKPTKTDRYMHLFDAHTPIEKISEEMKVKSSTVVKYFLNWLSYADANPYKSFIKECLPNAYLTGQILTWKTQGVGTRDIYRQLDGEVEYAVIQLIARLGRKGIKGLD